MARPLLYRDADLTIDGEHAYESGCWIWTGALNNKGVPMKRYKGGMTTATRALWQGEYGEVPEGLVIGSDCGTALCVRPSHHSPVTRTEVAYRTGRARVNEAIARRGFMAAQHGMTERGIARLLDVSARTAGRIARGEYWALRRRK
jgi:hypothetical protein